MLGCRGKQLCLFSSLGRGLSTRKQGKPASKLLAWSSALLGSLKGVAVCCDAQKGLGRPRHVLFKPGCKAFQSTATEHWHNAAALAQPHVGGGEGGACARARMRIARSCANRMQFLSPRGQSHKTGVEALECVCLILNCLKSLSSA